MDHPCLGSIGQQVTERILLLHAFSKVFEENLSVAFTTMVFLQTYADAIFSVN